MDIPISENRASPDRELETMLQDLLNAQVALSNSISSTSQFLRFVLNLANENLGVIRSQFETIQDLAAEIKKCGGSPEQTA